MSSLEPSRDNHFGMQTLEEITSSKFKSKSAVVQEMKPADSIPGTSTAIVPVPPECVPPPGVVKDTVLLYQGVQKKADQAQSPDLNKSHSYSSTGHYQSAIYNQSASQSAKVKLSNLSAAESLHQSKVHTNHPHKTATKYTQTSLPTPALSQSTPPTQQHHPQQLPSPIPPPLSPLFCSPLLPGHNPSAPGNLKGLVRRANMDETSSLNHSRDNQFGMQTSTPMDQRHSVVDFSNPCGRQRIFSSALSQASQDSSFSASEKTNTSAQFVTCTDYDTKEDEKLTIKRPTAVTFNSSVEEITTSIVSLLTDSGTGEGEGSTSHSSTLGLQLVSETEDFYCDDELDPSLVLDPNMQLLTDNMVNNISNNNWEEEQFNTAELGLTKEESNSTDYSEFPSGLGDSSAEAEHEVKFGSTDDKFETINLPDSTSTTDSNKNNFCMDVSGEVLTGTEVEIINDDVTKNQSVVEDPVWEGGDNSRDYSEFQTGLGNSSPEREHEGNLGSTDDIFETINLPDNTTDSNKDVSGEVFKGTEVGIINDDATIYESVVEDTEWEEDKDVEVITDAMHTDDVEKQNSNLLEEPNRFDTIPDWDADVKDVSVNENSGHEPEGKEVLGEDIVNASSDPNVKNTSVEVDNWTGEEVEKPEEDCWNEEEDDDEEVALETKWEEGDKCVARWEEDGCWYLAVVEGVEGDTAVVTFTQYGNSAYCPVELLREEDTKIGADGQLEVEETGDAEEWD
eukprot:GFUD01027017.1.p1 GENE.GFUD01027017.1~~GFUD01027017.1.p1  ORF type:complete len:747 (+),score=261.88 GFUD01027017.1:39-2243(+)